MEIANLVLDYIRVLIWPLVLGGLLVGFRDVFRPLAARMTQLAALGVTATFEAAVHQAEEVTDSVATKMAPTRAQLEKVLRVDARKYEDARRLATEYRAGRTVLLSLEDAPDKDAKRLVDFSAGMVFQSAGTIERIASKTFLLTPRTLPSGTGPAPQVLPNVPVRGQ